MTQSGAQVLIFDDGLRRMTVRYLEERPDSFYYRRRYPTRLRRFFDDKACRFESLHTKSKPEAVRKLAVLVARDNADWKHLETGEYVSSDMTKIAEARLASIGSMKPGEAGKIQRENERTREARFIKFAETGERDEGIFDPLENYLNENYSGGDTLSPIDSEMSRLAYGGPAPKRLSDALKHYLKEHPKGDDVRLARDATRAVNLVLQTVGDHPLDFYKREHAEAVRDALSATGVKTTTVNRRLTSISAVFADGIAAFSLNLAGHPFKRLKIRNLGEDSKKVVAFTDAELVTISTAIRQSDDDMRYILGLQLNTGARLAEIAGLRVFDVVLDGPVPHIIIEPFTGRSIKNRNSIRKVPLVGLSLWSAQRALAAANGKAFLFSRYMTATETKTNSASGGLNKWLHATIGCKKGTHSFRHSLLGRFRDIVAPEDIQQAIIGHGKNTVTRGYGPPHTLEVLNSFLLKVAL